jgi:RHH-type proline utilization regulon transcriptional repressor/proline dehydrogenase/delta 1-pyrroline-5-carboxylate dehydrogenase
LNNVGVPNVKKRIVNENWQISFYSEFEDILFPSGGPRPEIEKLIQFTEQLNYGKGFRREITIAAFPFLCAVRPEERAIYIGTRRLSRELALMKLHEVNSDISKDVEKQLFLLKEHVEKISTLSSVNFPTEIEWVSFDSNLPTLWNREQWNDIDEESEIILKQLVKKTSDYRSSLFEKVSDYGLNLTAQFDLIRVHLLKFLALLPSLDHDKSGREVKRNLLESLRRLHDDSEALSKQKKRGARPLPRYLILIFSLCYHVSQLVPAGILSTVVRILVRKMAKRFIAGESIASSHRTLKSLRATKREATLDQLGELVVSARDILCPCLD